MLEKVNDEYQNDTKIYNPFFSLPLIKKKRKNCIFSWHFGTNQGKLSVYVERKGGKNKFLKDFILSKIIDYKLLIRISFIFLLY